MAWVLVVVGVVMIAWGIATWFGLFPPVGGVHPDLVPMGLGVAIVGGSGFGANHVLGGIGFALIVLGFVLWFAHPAWLMPPWYRKRPRSR
jgi:hypothetical protein